MSYGVKFELVSVKIQVARGDDEDNSKAFFLGDGFVTIGLFQVPGT